MKITLIFLLLLVGYSKMGLAQEDNKECLDKTFSFFTGFQDYYIERCDAAEFGSYGFMVDRGARSIEKKGKFREVWYRRKENAGRVLSGLQILQNHVNALKAVGGQVVENSDGSVFRTTYMGKELWIYVNANTNSRDLDNYGIISIEIDAMKQEVSASDIKSSIDAQGKIAIYGIHFDTGKSLVKTESENALKEIAQYLTENPTVKVFVVGHTDNVGVFADNMKLSRARGESVKNYLFSKYKISIDRLTGEGSGSLCPVSSNDTEEGRILNRRVEIVKR